MENEDYHNHLCTQKPYTNCEDVHVPNAPLLFPSQPNYSDLKDKGSALFALHMQEDLNIFYNQ